MENLIALTSEALQELDSFVPAEARRIVARNPVVHGVVRRGGTGNFVTVTVRLDGSEPLRLDKPALDRVANLTHVPLGLLAELPDEVVAQALNAQLRRHWSWFTHALVYQDRVIEWIAPGWAEMSLNPSDVVRTCALALGEQPLLGWPPPSRWPDLRFLLTTNELAHVFQASPRANDRHHFFIRVQVNLNGWGLPQVEAVSHRLVCRNGMTVSLPAAGSRQKLAARTSKMLLEKLRDASFETLGYIRTVFIPAIESSLNVRADVEQLIQRLPRQVAALVSRAYQAEDLRGTKYHLVNALTRAANSEACPEEWRERLMGLAGQLTVGRRCWACLRRL